MHAAETSMACGQRRMVGRNSSITDRVRSPKQAAQITVNGRSVARCEEVNVPRSGRPRRGQNQAVSFANPFCPSRWYLFAHNMFQRPTICPGEGNSAISRAFLTAVLTCRCCWTVRPVT
jgi:hypothetical protein